VENSNIQYKINAQISTKTKDVIVNVKCIVIHSHSNARPAQRCTNKMNISIQLYSGKDFSIVFKNLKCCNFRVWHCFFGTHNAGPKTI